MFKHLYFRYSDHQPRISPPGRGWQSQLDRELFKALKQEGFEVLATRLHRRGPDDRRSACAALSCILFTADQGRGILSSKSAVSRRPFQRSPELPIMALEHA